MVDKEKAAKMKKSDIREDLKQYMPAPAADAGQRRRRWISLAAVGALRNRKIASAANNVCPATCTAALYVWLSSSSRHSCSITDSGMPTEK